MACILAGDEELPLEERRTDWWEGLQIYSEHLCGMQKVYSMQKLNATCQTLMELSNRSTIEDVSVYQDIAVELMKLKSVNRNVFKEYEALRSEVEASKETIDKGNLLLENLKYKQSHLKREIKSCKSKRYPNIDRVESDMNARLAPSSFSDDMCDVRDSATRAMLADFEERKALNDKLAALMVEHAELGQSLLRKRKLIDDVPVFVQSRMQPVLAELRRGLEAGLPLE